MQEGFFYRFTETDYYYGFSGFPREEMTRFFEEAQAQGWKNTYVKRMASIFPRYALGTGWRDRARALYRALRGSTIPLFIRNVFDASRAGFKFLLPLNQSGILLDYGSGVGTISCLLAPHYQQVVSLDLCAARLRFSRLRAQEEGALNLTYVLAGDRLPLPFRDQTFDTIILNGVLEWAPVSFSGPPDEAQTRLLREMARILKPAGSLFVAIENRYSLLDVLALIEGHTGLIWGAVLPRRISDLYSRLKYGKEMRVYTHSRRVLAHMLTEAGFESTHFFCPLPSYHNFRKIVSLEDQGMSLSFDFFPTTRRFHWVNRVLSVAADISPLNQLLQKTVPSFQVTAQKNHSSAPSSFLTRLLQHLGREMENCSPNLQVEQYLVRGNRVVVLASPPSSPAGVVIRLPLNPAGEAMTRTSWNALQALQDHPTLRHERKALFPRPLRTGILEGQTYFVEEKKSGRPGSYWVSFPLYQNRIHQAVSLFSDLWAESQTVRGFTESDFDRLFANPLRHLESVLAHSPLADFPQRLGDALRLSLLGHQTSLGMVHGDYHLLNLLFGKQGEIQGITDMDTLTWQGLPGVDLIALFSRYPYLRQGMNFGQAFLSVILPRRFFSFEQALWEQHARQYRLGDLDYSASAIWFWLMHVHLNLMGLLQYDPNWIQANVILMAQHLSTKLSPERLLDGFLHPQD
ncbi:MAG: hypothetical protein A2V67_02885 [Deltaproteobacteria bacterium RBG_13_61_14]|nr:MAG: hypothetical protein A2V67_02885 [Deltaproteobacteria bacterium RBG_13_61_14]